MALRHDIDKIIYKWVKKTYGESEAHNPSWSIVELAKELEQHFHELYWKQELEYLKEDVENYADGKYKLTEQQMYAVADRIRNSEWYCSINPEDMEYYIKDVLERSKQ